MGENYFREVYYFKRYYLDFFEKQKPVVQQKLNWTIELIAKLEKIPEKYFKHLTGTSGLYEIRVEVGSDIYRVFSFFDKGRLIIIINGFQKKTRKTPANEIERAEKIKRSYFDEK